MPAKVKVFLKGLISQILEPNSKEPEMQIGHPTDVKHVAHIGWDGPSVTPPTWMSEFKAGPDFSTAPLSSKEHRSSSRRSSHGVTSRKQSRRCKQMPGDSSIDSVPNNSSVQSTNTCNDILSREEPSEVSSHSIVQKERRRKKSKESSSIGGSVRSKSRISTASCSDSECTITSTKMRSLQGSKRVALQEV